jgi:hypothetical protein
MSASPVLVDARPAPDIEKKIRGLDERLQDLRTRRDTSEKDLNRLSREEKRLIREFSEAIGCEKTEIRGRLDAIAVNRTNQEREMAGLAAAIAETEQDRAGLLPEWERVWEEKTRRDRAKKLEELRLVHDANLEAVRVADKLLLRAREQAEKSFFDWTTFKDQAAESERQQALNIAKQGWQRFSGPNARR